MDSNILKGFKDKWIILRSVSDHRLRSLFPDKFGIIFKFEEIDSDHRRLDTYEAKTDRKEAFADFMNFINYGFDQHRFAIFSSCKKLEREDQLKETYKYSFQARCSCGYVSRIYKSLKQICDDESEYCSKCNDLLDIVRL